MPEVPSKAIPDIMPAIPAKATPDIIPADPGENQKQIEGTIDGVEIVNIGGKLLYSVFIPLTQEAKDAGIKTTVNRLTEQEFHVLIAYKKTLDFEKTAVIVGIKKDSARRIMARPVLKFFLKGQLEKTVKAAIGNPDYVKAKLVSGIEGEMELNDTQKFCMGALAKFVQPRGPAAQVVVQTTNVYGSNIEDGERAAREIAGGA